MAIQRRHQAAARRAADAGWSRTLTTGSRIPGVEKQQVNVHTIILLKSVCLSQLANCRSQSLPDRLGSCLKLFVSTESTSCHEFTSQFSLAIILYAKNTQNYRNTESPVRLFISMKQRPAIDRQRNQQKRALTPSWMGATDPSNSDNLNGDGSGWVSACVRA